jgi:hypothetical protein
MPLSSRLKRRRYAVPGATQLRDGLMERGIRPFTAQLYFVSLNP